MSTKLQPVRGTHDVLPEESAKRRWVVETARTLGERYGFGEIAVPIFEFTEVFKRTLGDTSDIVTKEMYTFTDRGGEELTLRPEMTAGIARALISGGLQQHLPLRLFATGPLFRYERPQKGRLRQFHQIDFEILGEADPLADIEVITLASDILNALGVADKTKLELNSLGDTESRASYRAALVSYLTQHKAALSEESRIRLEKNPLRILDSKDEGDRKIVANAPLLAEHYTPAAQEFLTRVTEGLNAVGVAYTLNPKLVRGLDYYCHTVFEFTTDALGAQNAVLAGGRYDGLVEMMGGTHTPSTGFAGGIERLTALAEHQPQAKKPLFIAPIGDGLEGKALALAHDLRHKGFAVEVGLRGNLGKRLKRADKINARAAVIFGGDELAKQVVTVKDLATGEQREAALAGLAEALAQYR